MIGKRIGQYRIVERLGRGGMGEVWIAEDARLQRRVALKRLPDALAGRRELLARFESEARALAALNHPNIVTVYSVEEDEGRPFITMELIEGRTLTERLADGGLEIGALLALAIPLTDAIGAAHRRGLTHRDLKPDNLMIDDEGRLKVLDFGLAKRSGGAIEFEADDAGDESAGATATVAAATREGSVLGTVAYMSPEQAQGSPVGPPSDVFSLGIVLYEMATGRKPFSGANSISVLTSILRDEPAPIETIAASMPAGLQRIVERCLNKDPEARYPNGSELRDDLVALNEQLVSGATSAILTPPPRAPRRKPWMLKLAIAAVALTAVGVAIGAWLRHTERRRWVHEDALPRLEAIVDSVQGLQEGPDAWRGFLLARQIEAVAPDEPRLAQLWPQVSRELSFTSEPSGATVSVTHYSAPDGEWVSLGRTPLEAVRFPLGIMRLRVEHPKRVTQEDVIWTLNFLDEVRHFSLPTPGELPDGMTAVSAGKSPLLLPGLDHLDAEPTAAFLIDRHETTHREFKRFVDAGGYTTPDYWIHPFVEQSRELDRDAAMARFVDRTGRPGPAGWELGEYPDGEDELPVSGVSWYEAAAYARWAGKELPTVFEWSRVALTAASSQIAPMSNFAGRGVVAAGETDAANRFGAQDLGGNVREWVFNGTDRPGQRFILGGGWSDPLYAFTDAYAQDAFDRSEINGFRCIRRTGDDVELERLARTIEVAFRDFRVEKPVSDEIFQVYLRQFDYDRTPLRAEILEEREMPSGLRRQKIGFDAAYDGERMMAYLFLPEGGAPPYQAVVLFPGSGAIHQRSSEDLDLTRADFLVKSGRAVLHPVLKGTYERGGELHSDYPSETASHKDYVIRWVKDVGRSIDYLESRDDIDGDRIAYYGLSWGGAMGAIVPAVETRFKANVLYVAGMMFQRALPEVDQINYVTRVRQPTLMLNGELDFFFPVDTSQKPMYELLGAPPEHKQYRVYPGGHSAPRVDVIKEALAWLDRYLGPTG